MNKKKQSHLYSELESLPLNKLYNSSNTEYFGFYAGLFSNFSEDYPNFANNFGIMFIDLAFYKWIYSTFSHDTSEIYYTKKETNRDFDIGLFSEQEIAELSKLPNIDFDIGFLSKKEIDELLKTPNIDFDIGFFSEQEIAELSKLPNIDFDIGFLSKKEIDELLRKSEEELLRKPKEKCTDYLYEAVKNHPYNPYYPPGIMF